MRQISFSNKSHGKPRLEVRADGSGEVQRMEVEGSLFKIGRSETADFQIDSAQVSREHAELVERSGVWFVRDLGSMNGTQVNGKAVSEALLSDGDILTIADTDLTFIASTVSQFQRMVTQPIPSRQRPAALTSLPADVLSARAATEVALWQVIPVELSELVSLSGGTTEALFATNSSAEGRTQTSPPIGARYVAAEHCRELQRIRAVELAAEHESATRVFVNVDPAELDFPNQLLTSLERIQEMTPSDFELGITISLRTILDTLKIEEIYQNARDLELLIAYDEFQGGGGQVLQLQSLPPDYLLLGESMVKDLMSTRQKLRRLESVRAACEQLAIAPVLPQNECEHTSVVCQQIGYDLALSSAATCNEVAAATPRAAQLSSVNKLSLET